MSRKVAFLTALMAIVLASCGTSPPVHYYSLEPVSVSDYDDGPDSTMIGMGPLRLPDYLKRSRIITRGAGSELIVHEQVRWAEPVDKAIHRVVAANVDYRLKDVIVVAYPYMETVQVNYTVVGQVDRFDSDAQGTVILDVQWAVLDEARNALISPQRKHYQTSAGDNNDPNALTRAMNEALRQFSEDIADQLGATLSEQ